MPIIGSLIKRGLTLGERLERHRLTPLQLQQKTLKRLLRKSALSLFGQYYNFREIIKSADFIEEFQKTVPVHDYDLMHDRWWHLSLNNVENVTWRGKVNYFALSSGTSGAPSKHIPVTEDMLKAMRRAGSKMFFNLTRFNIDPDLYTKDIMMLGGSSNLKSQGSYFVGDLSGISASKLPLWIRPFYKPGMKISKINDWNSRVEEIAKNALNWDIGVIVGIPAWLQLVMEKILEVHHLENIHQAWPNLAICVHGGVHFDPYRKGFERLLGKPITYMDSYMASEGFIAFQTHPDSRSMRLLLNNGIFYEFIPYNDENFDSTGRWKENAQTLTIEEVQTGVDYALLLSTCAGAWRYIIGDTVRFTNIERSEIVIAGRTKHYLSICGEHLSVDNMNQAVKAAEEELDISIPEFTVAAVSSGTFFAHRWYVGCDPMPDSTVLAEIIDRQLKLVNDDYTVERSSVLKGIQMVVVPPAIFYKWQEKQGRIGGQYKFPRVLRKDLFAEWELFVQQELPARQPVS